MGLGKPKKGTNMTNVQFTYPTTPSLATDVTEITTAQEIFNHVVRRLQNFPRAFKTETPGGEMCVYKPTDKHPGCAVGCLLSKSEYTPEMETHSVNGLVSKLILPDRLLPHVKLLTQLQQAHDVRENWNEYGSKFEATGILLMIAAEFSVNENLKRVL